jgi:ribosomal RNA-processing protein 8
MLSALYNKNDSSKPKKTIKKHKITPAEPVVKAAKHAGKKRELGDLSGSQFRWLNDMLYSTTSTEAYSEFNKDPNLFEAYHSGFARQAQKWPTNPVDQCISFLSRHSQLKTIGDFGCGEAKIAKDLHGKESRKIFSFDLVDGGNAAITACNIANVPLNDESLDVAIFNLSLMGIDWPLFVKEARRCLKEGGLLYISEVVSRLQKGVEAFEVSGLKAAGFTVLRSVASKGNYFHTFVAKKAGKKQTLVDADLLGKCPYKKR